MKTKSFFLLPIFLLIFWETSAQNFSGTITNTNADAIENAVATALDNGIHTKDIATDPNKTVNTAQMGDAITALID